MADLSPIWQKVLVAWIVVSTLVGYACLAYAVYESHGHAIRELVNPVAAGGV